MIDGDGLVLGQRRVAFDGAQGGDARDARELVGGFDGIQFAVVVEPGQPGVRVMGGGRRAVEWALTRDCLPLPGVDDADVTQRPRDLATDLVRYPLFDPIGGLPNGCRCAMLPSRRRNDTITRRVARDGR